MLYRDPEHAHLEMDRCYVQMKYTLDDKSVEHIGLLNNKNNESNSVQFRPIQCSLVQCRIGFGQSG